MTVNALESWISLQINLPRKTMLTRTALEAWQHSRLLQTIFLARQNSLWYCRHLEKVAVSGDMGTDDLLACLPFTTEEDIRDHAQEMLCCSQAHIKRVVTLHSSGTSAAPKRIFFTQEDLIQTRDFFRHGMRLVAPAGGRILILLPDAVKNDVGSLLVDALNAGGFHARSQWPADDPDVLSDAVLKFKAECLVGLPQHVLGLARMPDLSDWLVRQIKSVLLCSDYAAPCVRKAISENLDCRVHLHYGSTESGLGGAVQCAQNTGCHIRENDLLFEVIDPETGRKLPRGTDGELVFTTLTRTGMPLLRYRTGDLGRMITKTCACGSVIARLDHLDGRIKNAVDLPGGQRLTLADLDQTLLAIPEISAYEAELKNVDDNDRNQNNKAAAHGNILCITLISANPLTGRPFDMVRRKLEKIPSLAAQLTRDDLTIRITSADAVLSRPHTYKRKIVDNRESFNGLTHAKTS